MLQWRKWNVTVKLFMHVIQMYHKRPYPNVVKVMLFEGTWDNVVVKSKLNGCLKTVLLKFIGES